MRKALLAALVSAMLFAPAAQAQDIPHTLYWTVFASKGDGSFEDKPFMLVGYAGAPFPSKAACFEYGESRLQRVKNALNIATAPAKAGKDFDVKVGCKSAAPEEDA